ncbi:MAG: pilus assembly protein PilM [Planctomycetota bacterium]|jgi:Tfp pilus assembly protein PilN
MKPGTNTALGIDISDSRINLALLRRAKNSVKVLKAGSAPVPEGAITDGKIEEPEVLAKAIKELKSRNRILARKAAVSLSTGSMVVHILEAPKGAPSNVGQFVQKELKSYIALSGKEIAFDFCGIKSSGGRADRLLAVAADSQELAVLTRTCSRAGLDLEAVEPRMLAYVRAMYSERIEGRFDCNVLITILHDSVLTLCVFRKQTLDFVRVEHNGADKAEPSELCRWLTGQINAIIQFYDIEVTDSSGKWEVTVISDCAQLPNDVETSLKAEITAAGLYVRTDENACQDKLVDQGSCGEKASALAVGLAMGLLDVRQTGLMINLIPPESAEVKATRKQLLLTIVVIVVVVPLLMIAAGLGLNRLADKTKRSIVDRKQTELSKDTYTIFPELEFLNQQIDLISNRPDELNKILGSRPDLDWAKILNDVRVRTPESVRITRLSGDASGRMILKGLSLSYEAARLLEKMLNDSDYLSSASLTETTRGEEAGVLVLYQIDCSLKKEKNKT